LESFRILANDQTPPASRVGQNVNNINDPNAIRTAAGMGRKEEGFVPAANAGERTGETRRPMIGYM
jgi:hypothetical protein